MRVRSKYIFLSILVLSAAAALSHSPWVHASILHLSELIQSRNPSLKTKYTRPHQIHGAVSLYLTERGQSYFKNDLSDAIYRVSQAFTPKAINPNSGRLKDLEMKYAEPLDMASLSPKLAKPFNELKEQIHLWLNDKYLQGVNLNLPQPLLQLKNLDYRVEYSKLSIKFLDPNDPQSPQDTFRVLFEIEIPQLEVQMNDFKVSDLNNSLFGTFGSKSPSLGLNCSDKVCGLPLKISAQVTIQNERSGLSAKVSEIYSNLEDVDFELGYKPLILPSIQVTTNSHKYTINNAKLNQYLDDSLPSLLKSFQHFALEYVKNEFLDKTNTTIVKTMSQGVGSMDLMAPPGGPDMLPQSDYLRYGLSLFSSQKTDSLISIHMMGFAEDPKNQLLNDEMAKESVHVLPAMLNSLDQSKYDLALSLNESFLNQLLYLSFKRGYFNEIPIGEKGDTVLKLVSPPVIHFKDSEARLSLHVSTQMHGIATIAVKKEVEAKFDVLLSIQKNSRGGFKILITGTDAKSGYIDPRYIKILKKLVRKQFSKYLTQANKSYKNKPTVLAEHIPVPSELFGIPLLVESGQPESTGNFVIYLSLDRDQIELDKQDRRTP